MKRLLLLLPVLLLSKLLAAQDFKLEGSIVLQEKLKQATVSLVDQNKRSITDTSGKFRFLALPAGLYTLRIEADGFRQKKITIKLTADTILVPINLASTDEKLTEVVITGTQKAVTRLESPVPVEVYRASYFRKNPTPNIFEALQNVNGVRPQLNCNICNTGDIHINGLEGPYTMVLIDGMPMVSSLSTVYGLSGIPNALVEQIEVVKGPASSLYGSEAVGGLINIITKKVNQAPLFAADVMTTGYGEHLADVGLRLQLSPDVSLLNGINYFKYGNVADHNHDGFTDVTLQDRISLFQKWNVDRKQGRVFSMAGRFLYEDRWGGETSWTKSDRGTDIRYGESIYTKRFELMGHYDLPLPEKIRLAFSFTHHDQDSRYGTTSYIAQQRIAFSQLTWDKKWRKQDFLFGAAVRYTYYDDNTPATASANPAIFENQPEKTLLPGFFAQHELKFAGKHTLLSGVRLDHHPLHGAIFTPRLAYKLAINDRNSVRLNAGTGFRVVNLFTEDHAALTGAREVIVTETLKPERTYNVNLNYLGQGHVTDQLFAGLDISAFYTHFNNRILGDFDSDPNQIRYQNLDGYAISKGLTANLDLTFTNGLKVITGVTWQDVGIVTSGIKQQQILTERFSGTWAISKRINPWKLQVDYTGNVYGPMRLPLVGALDPRPENSPLWSVQNIQFTYDGFKRFALYGGIKNLLNFTPNRNTSFIIARANDPFDKNVQYSADGQVLATPENPYALTFDPNYVYAPNQGIRFFFGVKLTIN